MSVLGLWILSSSWVEYEICGINYFGVCEPKKEGEYFSMRGGKPKRENKWGGNNSVLANEFSEAFSEGYIR
jgi:hypothetical protein